MSNYCTLDQNNIVTNIVLGKVPGVTCIPWDGAAQVGWMWNGSAFIPPALPAPMPPSPTQVASIVTQSKIASLQRQAQRVQASNPAQAVSLLMQAQELMS